MVAKLKVVMFNKVAEWLEQSVEEILLYYAFPGVYWRRIPACDLLEQNMSVICRRTSVVSDFLCPTTNGPNTGRGQSEVPRRHQVVDQAVLEHGPAQTARDHRLTR